jgi:Na+/melibiose symporter-like transporter
LCGFLAAVVAIGAAGFIIDAFGYFIFFYVLGGVVTISGVLSTFIIKTPNIPTNLPKPNISFWSEFKQLINPTILRENRTLFLLFINMAISGIATQVYLPYIYIFLENYLGLTKFQLGIYLAIFLLITVVVLLIFGFISHKFNRRKLVLFGTIIGGILNILVGALAPALIPNPNFTVLLIVLYFIGTLPGLAAGVAHGGWLQDKYPGGEVGKFQGVRMIFMVLLPMVIGPPIGSAPHDELVGSWEGLHGRFTL